MATNLSVTARSGLGFQDGVQFPRYKRLGYVDPALTDGIPMGTLVYQDSADGYIKIADQNTDKGAMTMVYVVTNKPAGSAYELNPETNLMPQNLGGIGIDMEKKLAVELVMAEFRERDVDLTGTVATAGDTSLVGTGTAFTTELEVGDYILVGTEERQVSVITDDTNIVVSVAFTPTASGITAVAKGMINKPVFLGENGATTPFGARDYLENLTVLEPVTGDGSYQRVGYIDGSKNIIIDLSVSLEPTTV